MVCMLLFHAMICYDMLCFLYHQESLRWMGSPDISSNNNNNNNNHSDGTGGNNQDHALLPIWAGN